MYSDRIWLWVYCISGNIGIMEKKAEATIVYLGYIGNMALGILCIYPIFHLPKGDCRFE